MKIVSKVLDKVVLGLDAVAGAVDVCADVLRRRHRDATRGF